MRFKFLILKTTLLIGVTLTSTSAISDHSWNDYHWATGSHPIALEVVDSVTDGWQIELETALDEWNLSDTFDMSIASANDSNRTRKRCRTVSGKMRVCNAAYGFNGWLGLASINIDGNGHITKGIAKMNDSYSSYWADPNEKSHVMCQEIGHVLGLGHTSEDGSSQMTCMDYSSDPYSISPNAHDYSLLDDIYKDLDGYNSWSSSVETTDGGDSGGCNSPPGKGCNKFGAGFEYGPPMGIPVHKGRNHELWVASDGRGGYWVHHIRLVPEEFKKPSLHR